MRSASRLIMLFLAAFLVLAAGCSSKDDREEESVSAAELYDRAKRSMRNGAYDRAINLYRQLQSRYPFGRYAEQAQLELAYSYYKNYEPELAISTLNRFIRTYPTHPHIDYAHYLKGLVNFSRDTGFLSRVLKVEAIGKDQAFARDAFQDFGTLIERYPDSKYAADARERMLFLRNALAEYELLVARYYLRRQAYIAAANRAKYVVENFEETPEIDDALAILAEAYDGMRLTALHDDTVRVLRLNNPRHPYLAGETEVEEAWWQKIWPF